MQRKSGHSGHSVVTPVSTSRADATPRCSTARERRTMLAPNPHELTLARLSAILEATKPQFRLGAESDHPCESSAYAGHTGCDAVTGPPEEAARWQRNCKASAHAQQGGVP